MKGIEIMGIKNLGNKKWLVVARVRKDGKIPQLQNTIFGTKLDAERELANLKEIIRTGKNAEPPTQSSLTSSVLIFSDLVSAYRDKNQDFSRSHSDFIKTIERELGNVRIPEFESGLKAYLRILRNSVSRLGKKRSNAAINRPISIVKAIFNSAVKDGLVEKNPITNDKFPKFKEIPRDINLSSDDKKRLLEAIAKVAPHLEAIVRFSFQVPCRKSELINMRKCDLDLAEETIRIPNGTTKNDKGVYKPIPPDMLGYFKNLPTETEYLFYRKKKSGFHKLGDFKKSWDKARRLANLPFLRFHDSRHISATELVDSNTPEQAVLQVAGWKTNLLRTYYSRDPKRACKLVRFRTAEEKNSNAARNEEICDRFVIGSNVAGS
jgi:integrase